MKEAPTKCGYKESYSVECIHRLGSFHKNASRPRPIIARLHSYIQTESILNFARAKRGDIKITPQFPAELRSRRRELNDIAEDTWKKDRNVKTKIAGDTLYVNGERQVDRLPRLSTQELLCAPKNWKPRVHPSGRPLTQKQSLVACSPYGPSRCHQYMNAVPCTRHFY